MNNCEIEIDFVRQSFRVIRNPCVLPLNESGTSVLTSFQGNKQQKERLGKSQLTRRHLCNPKTPPIERRNKVDEIRSVNEKSVTDKRKDMAAGSIFTSIHVPLKPDNNFERIFNEMLPDPDNTEGRCFCHRRPKPEVDVNRMMLDLMNNLCKSTVSTSKPIESQQIAKSKIIAFQRSKGKSIQSMFNACSTFWIGAEYRYNADMNTLLLKFVLLGTPPQNTQQLYVDVRILDRKMIKVRRIKLKESDLNDIIMGNEIAVKMTSFQKTLEEKVHVQLEAKKGFLRITKHIDEWVFPLDDCNCMYQRSYWRNIRQKDKRV